MPRYAVINKQNIVVNVIEAFSSYRLPEGLFMVQTNSGDIGNQYIPDTNSFDKSNQMSAVQEMVSAPSIQKKFTGPYINKGIA